MASQARWEHFRHDADIGVRGWGSSIAAAFEQAALALTAVMTDPATIRCNESVNIECRAPNYDLLLYDWLNALVLEMAVRQAIFCRFEVKINGDHLTARVAGEVVSRERHHPAVEIKGATLTELSVAEVQPGLWRAQCVVDV